MTCSGTPEQASMPIQTASAGPSIVMSVTVSPPPLLSAVVLYWKVSVSPLELSTPIRYVGVVAPFTAKARSASPVEAFVIVMPGRVVDVVLNSTSR